MGKPYPKIADQDGDAPARSPHSELHSVLAANAAGATRQLLVDKNSNLLVSENASLNTRIKIYEQTNNTADNPVTFALKTDMDTKFSATDSVVNFLHIEADKAIRFAINGDTETISLPTNRILTITEFNLTTLVVTILTDTTFLRIIAEGL